jgi:hypothetical protein
MTDITIPPEALEKAAFEAAVAIHRVVEADVRANDLTEEEVTEIARAACLAMLEAWPEMVVCTYPVRTGRIILPLTQEPSDDNA